MNAGWRNRIIITYTYISLNIGLYASATGVLLDDDFKASGVRRREWQVHSDTFETNNSWPK